MASFRIERDLWAKFGAIAKRERLTVTDVLTDYIQRCTDNDRTEYSNSTGNDVMTDSVIIDNYDNDKLKEAVLTVINTLSLPSIDDVNTRIDEAVSKLHPEDLRREVSTLGELLEGLEKSTADRFDEIKKPLAIA
jgi:predicted DNA-binding ribbon-helix-helix protein